MAKMHSRARGKSGSKKPAKLVKKTWVRYDAKTAEQLIIKLAKAGKAASEIGLILRDSYGIPDVKTLTDSTILKILQRNNLSPKVPEDLKALVRRSASILKHLEIHKKDMHAKRGLILTESKINRLAKYFKLTNKLPQEWSYNRKNAKVLAE